MPKIADESAPTPTHGECLHAQLPVSCTLWLMRIHGHGTGHSFAAAFTLLELLITLSIASIVLIAGVPAFQNFTLEQQMKAERDRRARVTEAEGYKAAEVLRAEGERDAQVATAEGDKLAAIMRAEGEAQAILRLAEAEKSKLNLVAEAMPQQFAEYLIGTRYMETLDNMAANNNVVWMPHGAQDLGGFIGGYKALLGSGPVQPTAASTEPS